MLQSTRPSFRALRAAAVAALLSVLACADSGPAAAAGPFAALAGSWSGAGTVLVNNGANERIRCRATYQVHDAGNSVDLNLRCASDSYNFDLVSNVRSERGEVSGSWTEATRNASGTLSGRAEGNQILVSAQGAAFAANFLLVTRGDRQSVSMRSRGSDITGVDVALSRR